jgi:hypothetical protein
MGPEFSGGRNPLDPANPAINFHISLETILRRGPGEPGLPHPLRSARRSGGASEPGLGFVFQSLVTEGDTGSLAAAAADALFRVHVDGALLVRDGVDGADMHGIAVLAVMWADNIEHMVPPLF